ncbi:hypothetical protein M409DRAFT_70737 [Zasmidium cellare ATCC 36951]|uniref:Zn(2)-C6 fungal-type domain-containing protein n=1 Tax=Zasmidium cellare ATCC 36951 TaxID=1080233 RepID=A0A6A6C290_ZASCE|nr:uncharacterized protein M409DRAFT_70737 [Zasmidium cellare ATCC 36951]KAF2159839.1 hypothetical protein M409DRAFT_70737 [Zasmidium cellare ATCC 36951]
MRPGKGCASCRDRHLKCVTESGNTSCTRCLEAERQCTFGPKYLFRQVSHVDGPGQGVKGRQELSYGRDQVWVSTRKHCKRGAPISGLLSPIVPSEVPRSSGAATIESLLRSDTLSGAQNVLNSTQHRVARPQTASHGPVHDFSSPASIEELTKRHEDGLNATSPSFCTPFPVGSTDGQSPTQSLPTPSAIPKPNLSRREAYLVQHFINKIGPWMDVCDLYSHFTHELPRRAMHKPLVLFSLLAISSRHLAILTQQPEPAEASFYHGQCLRLVIEQLAQPGSIHDDNLLATVVCLRIYEEIEHKTDNHLHLAGTSRLLRAIPTFAHSGGLGEAACWQSLRQDIYICLTRGLPPSLDLESFEASSVFTFRDDAACANIIVLWFAKILRLAYSNDHKASTDWNRLALDVEAWNDRRLRLFQPIYYEDFDTTDDRPFPVIHMISPPQVTALQYYHACKAFLLLHKPHAEVLSGFQAAKRRRTMERDVTSHLVAIVGLAESNPFVENANFTAHHLLRIGGYCITNPVQRQCVLDFLDHVERVMGWSTSATIALLKDQWSDLDCPND